MRDAGHAAMVAKAWMRAKFNDLAQWDPRSSNRWLPSSAYTTKRAVWDDYVSETATSTITYDYFTKLWSKDFSNVKFPRYNAFAQCDVCLELDKAILRCTVQSNKEHDCGLKALQARKKEHLEAMTEDRQHYREKK